MSVLQHLAASHGDATTLRERRGVLQASLHLVAPELSIKRLATELLRHSKVKLLSEVTAGFKFKFACIKQLGMYGEFSLICALQDEAEASEEEQMHLESAVAAFLLCSDTSGQGLFSRFTYCHEMYIVPSIPDFDMRHSIKECMLKVMS